MMKISRKYNLVLYNIVNVINATDLHTLKCHLYFTAKKVKKKKSKSKESRKYRRGISDNCLFKDYGLKYMCKNVLA